MGNLGLYNAKLGDPEVKSSGGHTPKVQCKRHACFPTNLSFQMIHLLVCVFYQTVWVLYWSSWFDTSHSFPLSVLRYRINTQSFSSPSLYTLQISSPAAQGSLHNCPVKGLSSSTQLGSNTLSLIRINCSMRHEYVIDLNCSVNFPIWLRLIVIW